MLRDFGLFNELKATRSTLRRHHSTVWRKLLVHTLSQRSNLGDLSLEEKLTERINQGEIGILNQITDKIMTEDGLLEQKMTIKLMR